MSMTMKLIASLIMAFLISTVFGKFYIPWLHKQKAEQAIKENGPTWHAGKSGTPTMGGVMFILAVAAVVLTVGFSAMLQGHYAHLFILIFALVFGAIGMLDDWEKIKNKHNTGLSARSKFLLQLAAALAFVILMRNLGLVNTSLYVPFTGGTIHIISLSN